MTNPIEITATGHMQDRINQGISENRPVIITPGMYNLSEGITIAQVSHWKLLIAPGATLRATVNMDVMIDIDGMAYSEINGGLLTAADGVIVGTMMRYRWTGTGRSSTSNQINNIHFERNYGVGLQVGSEAHALQTDNTKYHNLTFGGGDNDHETLYQMAIYLVQSAFANTMLHDFYGASIGAHKTGVLIDKARHVQFFGGGPSGCAVDFDVRAVDNVALHGVRSENGGKLLVANSLNVGWSHNVGLYGCNFDAPHATMNNPIIDFTQGMLNINGLQIDGTTEDVLPQFKFGYGQKNAYVSINGLRIGTDAELVDPDDLFDCNTKANIRAYGIVKTDASGGQVDDECVEEYRVSAGVAV